MKTPEHDGRHGRLHERIGALIARGQFRRALELLDRIIEDALPLFQGADWVTEERRLAWLYRIELLREAGRLTEALAWACLEVEIDPDNVAAMALKERLKREAGLLGRPGGAEGPPTGSARQTTKTAWAGVAGMRDLKAMLERDVILAAARIEDHVTQGEAFRRNRLSGLPRQAARPASRGKPAAFHPGEIGDDHDGCL